MQWFNFYSMCKMATIGSIINITNKKSFCAWTACFILLYI